MDKTVKTRVDFQYLNRLLIRWGPHYPHRINLFAVLSAIPTSALGVYYVLTVIPLTIQQIVWLILVLLVLEPLVVIAGQRYISQITRNMRSALSTPPNQRSEDLEGAAWQEVTAFPRRMVLRTFLHLWGILVVPGTMIFYAIAQIKTQYLPYLFVGNWIATTWVAIFHYFFLEWALWPARRALLPRSPEIQQRYLSGANARSKILIIITALILTTSLMMVTVAIRKSAQAIAPGANPVLVLRSLQNHMLFIGGTSLTFSILFAILLARSITTPIQNLANAMTEVERGSLSQRAELVSTDETGQLTIAFNQMVSHLEVLQTGLEEQVAQRTADLARRTAQLEAAASVARRTAEIRDLDTLLNETVRLISERFGFYHAGIFLVDDLGVYAVLRAASSEGGQRMLARGHKLAVGKVGIVGYTAGTGKPRVALDVGTDATFFDNPDLPLTRSEMALPLKIGDRVIGVLDVQSEEPAAFTDEDVAVLQTMADQIALAIENIRLLEESQQRLRELETLYGERLRQMWERVEGLPTSLLYDRVEIKAVDSPEVPPATQDAMEKREVTAITEPDNGRAVLAAPLRLGDRVIGAIALEETDAARTWSEDEIALVSAVSEQVALALESARLYQMEQRRRFIADTLQNIARLVGSTLDLHEVTERLLDQLERLIPFDTAAIHLIHGEQREILGGRGINLETTRRWLQKQPPLSQDPLLNEVIRTRTPVIVRDTRTDPRWKRPGARSGMAIPLLLADQVIGLLLVDHHQPGVYDAETATLASAVAAQAAIAIQNARLYSEAERTARQMQALYETSRVLSASLEEEKVLRAILETISRLMDCEFATISLVDEMEGTIGIRYGIWQGQYNVFPEWIEMARYPLDHPDIIADVYRTGRTEIIAGWDDRFNREIYEKFGHERLLRIFMPIRVRERTLGVIEVGYDYSIKQTITEEEVNLLAALVDQSAVALYNAYLFAETQERANEQEGLARIAALAVSTLELDELLRGVLQEAVSLAESEGCVLFLSDETAYTLQPAQVLLRGNFLTDLQWQIPIDAPGMEQSIFRRGGAYYSNIGLGDPNIIPAYMPYMERLGVRNFCGVALRVRDQNIGELYFVNRPGGFGHNEVRLAQAIAGYLANALANTRLLQETRLRAEELAVLNELGQTLTARLNVEEVIEAAYQGASRLLDTTNFYIAFYEPESQTVSFPLAVEKGARRQWRSRQAGNGLTEYIIRTRAPLLIPEKVPQRLQELGIEAIGETAPSWLGVPLMIGDRVLGVMAVQSYAPERRHTPHDLALMTAIASQVAIALQNARSYEEAQRRAERERLARQIMERIQAAPDVESVLQTAARELGRALQAPRTLIRLGVPAKTNGNHPPENPG